MAGQLEEAWTNANGTLVAVRNVEGGYEYYLCVESVINGQLLKNHPVVAREISSFNLEIMDAKHG